MSILADGLSFLQTDLAPILALAVTSLGLGLWFSVLIPVGNGLRLWMLPLAPAAGGALLALLSLGLFVLVRQWPGIARPGSLVIVALGLAGLARALPRGGEILNFLKGAPWLWLVIAAITILLVARLAFLRTLLLPPYYDSPQHFAIVQNLVAGGKPAAGDAGLGKVLTRYYHLGFHGIAAWTVSLTEMGIAPALSLLGQLMIVLAPLSVLGLSGVLMRDARAAGFAALLAGVGWKMPAFAANWGKYPAITALAILPAVLGIALWLPASGKGRAAWLLLAAAAAGVVLIHTRAAILLGIALISLAAASKSPFPEDLRLGESTLISLMFAPVFLILRDPLLQIYADGWRISLALVVVLLPFAIRSFPRIALGLWLFLLGVVLASRIQLPEPLSAFSAALLDATFVQISLFVPLSLLGGLGAAGLALTLDERPYLRRTLLGLLAGLIVLNFSVFGPFYPDPCCNYVRPDDLDALQWIEAHTPPDAVIIVSAFRSGNQMMGTDGGMWVRERTGRNANKRPFNLDWASPDIQLKVCRPMPTEVYVYDGDTQFSFQTSGAAARATLVPVFTSDSTRVYRVVGCPT